MNKKIEDYIKTQVGNDLAKIVSDKMKKDAEFFLNDIPDNRIIEKKDAVEMLYQFGIGIVLSSIKAHQQAVEIHVKVDKNDFQEILKK